MKPKFWILAVQSIIASFVSNSAQATDLNDYKLSESELKEVSALADYLTANGLVYFSKQGKINMHKSLLDQLKAKGAVKFELASEGTSTVGGGCKEN